MSDGDVITATAGHPFWVAADEVRRVHNLTVEGIHTYYVLAGDDPVLVHNCGGIVRTTDRELHWWYRAQERWGLEIASVSNAIYDNLPGAGL